MENEKKLSRMNELTDDQLDNVVGGAKIGDREQYECSICGAQVLHEYRRPGVVMVANNTRSGTMSM